MNGHSEIVEYLQSCDMDWCPLPRDHVDTIKWEDNGLQTAQQLRDGLMKSHEDDGT
jgi:hypothetical protein